MLEAYDKHVAERAAQGIPPLPLNAEQVAALVAMLTSDDTDASLDAKLLDLLENRVPAGVDEAAYVKAAFLADVAAGKASCSRVSPLRATELLGTMLGGYNVAPLIERLQDGDAQIREAAVAGLSRTLLVFDAAHDVAELAAKGCEAAAEVQRNWADAAWFESRPQVPDSIRVAVFRVPGEINTDDLSPAQDAFTRPDIPLHALAMLKNPREGMAADPLGEIARLRRETGLPVAFVGDVVGTGSSRKSAANSVLWHIGDDIPHIPNKRGGGVVLGGKIAPIFFNTLEDAGALPIECDVGEIANGDVLDIRLDQGRVVRESDGAELAAFALRSPVILDEVRAGGRTALIIGRALTDRVREGLGEGPSPAFRRPETPQGEGGFTLAQKMIGRACGVEGVRPGTYCEPKITTVGSQDTTGPMTRDEMKDLACLGFSADLVMQSFCHTAAYPKPVDIDTQHSLPEFFHTRGGVALRPGDGIIHSWLNRMLLPDTLGTGADSHTRFPIGISFPAGSGLVAFAAALGVMPLDVPESVLVRFKGEMQPGITLRDLVNAIPWAAIQAGELTVGAKGKKNVFSGRILEIEGLPDLKIEQAFEFADASAERSAGGCTVRLDRAPIEEYLNSNIVLLRWMIKNGYGSARTLARRIQRMEEWLEDGVLMQPDPDAKYACTLEIDLNQITEPLLACPNDPDDIKPLSEVANTSIDEVFIGSCMTNIGHFRAAGEMLKRAGGTSKARLWVCPPTRMDEHQLMEEGYYNTFGVAGARTEMPGCSLCMGNQARVQEGASVISTSTRNFPNRLGKDANVFLGSAELSALSAVLGRLPSPDEYRDCMRDIDTMAAQIYRYLNFHEIEAYRREAEEGKVLAAREIVERAAS